MYCFALGLSNVKGALAGAELHTHFTALAKSRYA